METVFDYDITEEEWNWIRGSEKDWYLSNVGQDTATADIAALFFLRGDRKKAEEISKELPSEMYWSLWRTLLHP